MIFSNSIEAEKFEFADERFCSISSAAEKEHDSRKVLPCSSNDATQQCIGNQARSRIKSNSSRKMRDRDSSFQVKAMFLLALGLQLLQNSCLVDAFGINEQFMSRKSFSMRKINPLQISFNLRLQMGKIYEDNDLVHGEFGEGDLDSAADGGIVLDDLNWRVEKLRLEEQNRKRFLKSKPRFLPYDECRKWVQAFGRWETEEEWKEWIAMGEKRNSYIPSRPDEYYGGLGKWISWDHFLLPDKEEDGEEDGNDGDN